MSYGLQIQDMHYASQIGLLCKKKGLTVCTAESCTSGRLASALTLMSGSSEWFKAGIVAYTEEMKEKLLGVPMSLIIEQGVVSAEVARAMALKVCHVVGADVGIAATGFAGPSGGTDKSPVGTVWMSVALKKEGSAIQELETYKVFAPGTRDQITTFAVSHILFRTFTSLSKVLG